MSSTQTTEKSSKESNEKIKVVFGVNDFLVGGMQNQFVEQLKFYDRKKFEIILVTLFSFPEQPNFYAELPADLAVYQLNTKGLGDIRTWLKAYSLLRTLQPDIVVSSLFDSNFIFRILKPFVGYVSIAREHNTYVDKKGWQRAADRALATLSYRIVAVSTTVADFTASQERIPRTTFEVIHNGIDPLYARAELEKISEEDIRKKFDFSADERIFLNIGRLVPQKNHQLFIDGFALFHDSFPDYTLVIVGDGVIREGLEAYAHAKGIGESIRFFGFRRDVWNFYKIADAFVSTSRIEGLSNNYLEALAAGIPLIATKTAGTDELLLEGKNGFFISEATKENVAQTMTTLHQATKEDLQMNALESVRNFDIRVTVEKYSELFIRAAARS